MTKRKKKIVFSIIAIPFLIVALHFQFYFAFKKVIHADRSVNPIATNYFAHAMLIDMGAKLIHDYLFIDYDSFVLKPLLSIENLLFDRGRKYVSPDNIAEEGAWWALLHIDKFGLIKTRTDKSMDLSHLPNEESLAIRNQAYNYFLHIVNSGVKGIDLKDKEFSAVYALFVIPFRNISKTYPGKTEKERIMNYWADSNNYQKAFFSYQKFKRYIENNKYYKKMYSVTNKALLDRLYDLIGYNFYNSYSNTMCGSLADDYLNIITSLVLKGEKFGKTRTKNINTIFEAIIHDCPERKLDIVSIQKKFQ